VFRTILLTTDFSDLASRAAVHALEIAERFGAEIVVVHVLDPRRPAGLEDLLARSGVDAGVRRDDLAEAVDRHAESLLGNRVPWTTEIRDGAPHEQILRVAAERRVDLIVIATHGRGALGHALLGSTTERVLRRAPCPVLAVRVPAGEGGAAGSAP
jgi:nucleotide-binding universal stress UspA family protein